MESIKVLIVEDEFVIASDLKMLLESANFQVVGVASNSIAATELYIENLPDIILTDIHLKGEKTGLDLILDLRKRSDYCSYVIVISAYTEAVTIEKALAISPVSYITKPFTPKQVITSVNIAKNMVLQRKIDLPTARELEIIRLLSLGNSVKLIGNQLNISHYTVETHIKNTKKRYGVNSSSELVTLAIRRTWI